MRGSIHVSMFSYHVHHCLIISGGYVERADIPVWRGFRGDSKAGVAHLWCKISLDFRCHSQLVLKHISNLRSIAMSIRSVFIFCSLVNIQDFQVLLYLITLCSMKKIINIWPFWGLTLFPTIRYCHVVDDCSESSYSLCWLCQAVLYIAIYKQLISRMLPWRCTVKVLYFNLNVPLVFYLMFLLFSESFSQKK